MSTFILVLAKPASKTTASTATITVTGRPIANRIRPISNSLLHSISFDDERLQVAMHGSDLQHRSPDTDSCYRFLHARLGQECLGLRELSDRTQTSLIPSQRLA